MRHAALEQANLDTGVGLGGFFPAQVGVGQAVDTRAAHAVVVIDRGVVGAQQRQRRVGGNLGVTRQTVAGAEFQVRDNGVVFQEILFRYAPGQCRRGEYGELVVLTKLARPIGAGRYRGQVAVAETVVDPSEVRVERKPEGTGTHTGVGGTGSQVIEAEVVGGEVIDRRANGEHVGFLPRNTQQPVHRVILLQTACYR